MAHSKAGHQQPGAQTLHAAFYWANTYKDLHIRQQTHKQDSQLFIK